MLTNTKKSPYAKVSSLPFDAVEWTGGLWAESFKICADATVPQLKHMFDSKDISHVVENFKICAGDSQGEHNGTVFGDGDFYKWMEAALYTATKNNNQKLLNEIEEYIDLISRAQQPDGYLSTKQIIGEMNRNGIARMGDINDFEVYNFGHLFTCACLHHRITGKDNFMMIAKKTADYLYELYQEAARTGEVQTAVCPSHYMGLIEMYRTTEDNKYLELAKLAIELRDSVKDGTDDNQDRIPLKQHEKIVGHAVRSNYLYSGVADLYAELGDEEYKDMLHRVWEDLLKHKLYLTNGCGALYNGVSPYGNFFKDQKTHQSFGYEYQLPNITAYNETCANIGLVMWAYRMFNIEQKAEYLDIIERTMLNVNLAAISLDGKRYFYENMLRRAKKLEFEMVWSLERTEYITSYCCPPNLARNLAQSYEYAYSVSEDSVYLGMYGANKAHIRLDNGTDFELLQQTNYPYEGAIKFNITKVNKEGRVIINIRIPSWAENGFITLSGGEKRSLSKKDANTFIPVELNQLEGAEIEVYFEMAARLTVSHPLVEENSNQVAVEKGPLVYCVESNDADIETLDDLLITPDTRFEEKSYEIAGREIQVLEGELYAHNRVDYDRDALYQTLHYKGIHKLPVRLIPYFAWDNRGYGEMRIWLPVAYPVK